MVGRLSEDQVPVQVGLRLEEAPPLGVTHTGGLHPCSVRVPWPGSSYFMALPVGSSGSLGAKRKLLIFLGPQLGFPG